MICDGKAPESVTAATDDHEMVKAWGGHVKRLAQHVGMEHE